MSTGLFSVLLIVCLATEDAPVFPTPYDACSGRFYIQPVSGKCRHLFTRYSTGLF